MSNTFNDQCGFSLNFFLRQWLCTNYWVMFPAITVPFFFAVSMTTTMTCLAPPTEGGRLSQSFPLRQNAFSHNRVFFLFVAPRTYCSYDNSCVPTTVCLPRNAAVSLGPPFLLFVNMGKFRARVWFKILHHCLVFWHLWGFKDVSFFMSCLTIATTAAPAPARAQTNRWKVMSSCGGQKKKKKTDQRKHHYPSQCHVSVSTV